MNYPDELRSLCRQLTDIVSEFDLFIVPGGGIFADAVREAHANFKFPEEIAHKMAVLATDQYGLILNSLFYGSSKIIDNIEDAEMCFKKHKIALFQASKMMRNDNHLPKSWSATSDSIAAYVADLIGAERLILIKAIDGVIERNSNKLVFQVAINSLNSDMYKECVDEYIPNLLKSSRIQCFIVNGRIQGRVESILRGEKTVCTEIIYD